MPGIEDFIKYSIPLEGRIMSSSGVTSFNFIHAYTHMHTYACTHLSKCKNTILPYVYFKVFSSRSQADTGRVGGR